MLHNFVNNAKLVSSDTLSDVNFNQSNESLLYNVKLVESVLRKNIMYILKLFNMIFANYILTKNSYFNFKIYLLCKKILHKNSKFPQNAKNRFLIILKIYNQNIIGFSIF